MVKKALWILAALVVAVLLLKVVGWLLRLLLVVALVVLAVRWLRTWKTAG